MHGSAHDFIDEHRRLSAAATICCWRAMNAVAAFYLWHYKHRAGEALVWLVVGAVLVVLSPLAMSGSPPAMPRVHQALSSTGPPGRWSIASARPRCWSMLFVFRRFFVQPTVAWALLNLSLLI